MCKHGNVFSLPLLTDERLTIGISHLNVPDPSFLIAMPDTNPTQDRAG